MNFGKILMSVEVLEKNVRQPGLRYRYETSQDSFILENENCRSF